MIKIKKGDLTCIVTRSVYETHYENNGWQICGENETIKQDTPEKTVENDLTSMSMAELREYADANGIDITGATSKKEIRAIIESAIDI